MTSERSRTTAKAPPLAGSLVRRCLLVFEPARTRAVDLPREGTLVIGRGEDVDIVLQDSSVSRRQVELVVAADGVVARDLGSSNGTFLDEQPLQEPHALRPGAVLRLGTCQLVLGASQTGAEPACLSNLEIEARLATRIDAARSEGGAVAVFLVRSTATRESVARPVREILGGDACVGDYAPDHYEAVARADPRAHGTNLARELASALRSRGMTARAACALFPGDGSSAGEVLAACRAALRNAEPQPSGSRAVVVDQVTRRVFDLARRVAKGRIPVLIKGDTGTGKEILAEHVQSCSPRAARPFVRVNCAALPEPLLEAELFGYEKGAFTGAHRSKPGLFEAADGGTLLLDEVGELPAGQQAKLLRALEDGTVRRLGSLEDRKVDVRLIAATNRDLEQACARGTFRSDLYFRLSGAVVTMPPLRERPGDLLALAHRFLSDGSDPSGHATLEPETEAALLRHSWPGNVRELRNAMERAVLLTNDGSVRPEHLPERVRLSALGPVIPPPGDAVHAATSRKSVRDELREVERVRIVEALEACDGNQTRAARMLDMPRRTLVAKLASLGLSRRRS
ncbi:MAG: sigma 54-interacting transcriptional regulator [Deltaproteobacteria bacterium]|nr:sigma 54-interacting transcriptional regulator [Deltaproteobacteria bacterium]